MTLVEFYAIPIVQKCGAFCVGSYVGSLKEELGIHTTRFSGKISSKPLFNFFAQVAQVHSER